MRTGKITEIGIKYNYGFYNGGYIKYKIGKIEYFWHSTDRLIENFCMELGIYTEDNMQKLNKKRFKILDEFHFDNGDIKFEIEFINKKINPEHKKIDIFYEN